MLKLSNFPIIEIDDQLYLREQKYADAENFFNYISKYEVRKYILSNIPTNLNEAKDEIIYWIDLFYRQTGIYWAITLKKTEQMIGSIGFHDLNYYNNRAEISYDLDQKYWGKGIMSKVMQQILKYGFEVMGIERIQASTVKENNLSIKILARNGFKLDGTLRHYRLHNGKYYDIEMYSKLRNDL